MVVIKASTRFLKIKQSKLEKTLNKIRNKTYLTALQILFSENTNETLSIWKLLHSAAANAFVLYNIKKSILSILDVYSNKCRVLKKNYANAKGKSSLISRKYFSVILKIGNI